MVFSLRQTPNGRYTWKRVPLRRGILGVSSPRVDLTPESDAKEQKKIAKIFIQVGIRPDRRAGGMLDISAGSEAAVWDNWSEEIHFKINGKMMENQWKSTWVGASWAMLAQNDTFLKRSWRKMTERIDCSMIFRTILGYQNHTKIDEKIKWFSDALKNYVFCAWRSPVSYTHLTLPTILLV